MADSLKITELPALTTASDDDVLVIVDQPGSSGFAETNKITRANLFKDHATKAEVAGKANTVHTHAIADVTSLQTTLDGKSVVGHTHTPSTVGLNNVPNVDATARGNHTGTQSADTIVDGTTNKAYTAAEQTKLAGVATGATQNATNASLRDRSTHTGTQASGTISDFTEAVQDVVGAQLVAGTNVTVTYDDTAGTTTIASSGGGGGTNATNLTTNQSTTDVTVISDTGTDATIPTATGSLAGVLSASDKTKLNGIATGATANDTDTNLKARANHTGTQTASTISNFDTQVRTSRLDQMAAPTAAVPFNSQKITGLATPTNTGEGANKDYVDSVASGKANSAHTHGATDITDFSEAVDDRIAVSIVAGTGISKTYDDAANTLTIAATGGGGGSSTPRSNVTFFMENPPTSTTMSSFATSFATGGTFALTGSRFRLGLDGTANARVQMYRSTGGGNNPGGGMKNIAGHAILSIGAPTVGDGTMYFRWFSDSNDPTSGIANQAGFNFIKVAGTTTLSASSGNGTTEQTTAVTGVSLTGGNDHTYAFVQSSTDVKFYVDGVLKATHATSIPDPAALKNYFCLVYTRATSANPFNIDIAESPAISFDLF